MIPVTHLTATHIARDMSDEDKFDDYKINKILKEPERGFIQLTEIETKRGFLFWKKTIPARKLLFRADRIVVLDELDDGETLISVINESGDRVDYYLVNESAKEILAKLRAATE